MNQTQPPGAAKGRAIDEVERLLPPGQLFTLGLQHVLVMYAGAVAVPLVIGGSLGLPKDQISYLISSDLFSCGSRSSNWRAAWACCSASPMESISPETAASVRNCWTWVV